MLNGSTDQVNSTASPDEAFYELKAIEVAIQGKKAFLESQKISSATVEKINNKLQVVTKDRKIPKKNIENELNNEINSLYVQAIFEIYADLQNQSSETSAELNHLITIEFGKQQSIYLPSIVMEHKDGDITQFKAKSSLKVESSNGSEGSAALGLMTGKTSVTLYADKLKAATNDEKNSFYENVFLKAMYGESFKLENGEIKLLKSTLSIASLPKDLNLKQEAIDQLAAFKKKYPNVDIKYDSLLDPDDKRKLAQALEASNNFNKLVFNTNTKKNDHILETPDTLMAAKNKLKSPASEGSQKASVVDFPPPPPLYSSANKASEASQKASVVDLPPPPPLYSSANKASEASQKASVVDLPPPPPLYSSIDNASEASQKASVAIKKPSPWVVNTARGLASGVKVGDNPGRKDSDFQGIPGPALAFGKKNFKVPERRNHFDTEQHIEVK